MELGILGHCLVRPNEMRMGGNNPQLPMRGRGVFFFLHSLGGEVDSRWWRMLELLGRAKN